MWDSIVQTLLTIICTALASSGFWAYLQSKADKIDKSKSEKDELDKAMAEMLVGLGHDRIVSLANGYIEKGSITLAEYHRISYLFKPYERLGGNGEAKKAMDEVEQLPIIKN